MANILLEAEAYSETYPSDLEILEARAELWKMGILTWKLDVTQQLIYDFYKGRTEKTIVVNASRRLGKTYAMFIIALEQALNFPNSIIKFIQPELSQLIKNVMDEVFLPILQDCPLELQPTFRGKDNVFVFKNGSKIQLAGTDNQNYNKIRGGSCIGKDTEIMTPYGPTKIQDIQVGDVVYGYNKDGSVSPTIVKNKFDNGIQDVTEIYWKNNLIGTCTDEHVWLTTTRSKIANNSKITQEFKFGDINQDYDLIVQRHVPIPCGIIDVPDAYVVGALIGDGCLSDGRSGGVRISSEDHFIPKQCADILDCYYRDAGSYSWHLRTTEERYKHTKNLKISYFDEWLNGKKADVKNFDYETVDQWNRESCLKLLAGLTDTDGNVYYNSKDSSLEWSYTSINLDLVNNIQKLIYKLFQFTPSIKSRKHKKSINQQYTVRVRNSFYVKQILKELTPYLALDRKKYHPVMEGLVKSKHNGRHVKITKGKKYKEQVYDIEVDNETHLFLTASGLVTHNCHLAIIDEAGFCSDLDHILKYILVPTTLLTRGRIIFGSTTPPTPDHEFIKYMEAAEAQGRLIRKTIWDAVTDGLTAPFGVRKITKEYVDEIIQSYMDDGGENSDAFRTEYMCEVISNSDMSVLPEFTKEVQGDTIMEWPRPAFCDGYESLDIGFVDMTGVLFAYYDYDNGVLVVEDELIFKGQEVSSKNVAEGIKKKEDQLWRNKYTGEVQEPYQRWSDNNLIFINDLSQQGVYFMPTEKHKKAEYITKLKTWIKERRVIIHPRCVNLISHMKGATWNKDKKDFIRNAQMKHHYDLVAALLYLVRNIDETRNPYPRGYKYAKLGNPNDIHYKRDPHSEIPDKFQHFKKMFTAKSSFGRQDKPIDDKPTYLKKKK